MRLVDLGTTGIQVSRLIYGSAYLGPLGEHLAPEAGADLLLHGLEQGITVWDTSDDYGSHPHVAAAIHLTDRAKVVVASKSSEAPGAIERILGELGTDYLDILYIHCVGPNWIDKGHDALRAWQSYKQTGQVKALGLTTHSAAVAKVAAEWPEVDVMMLPLNTTGALGNDGFIENGSIKDMLAAAKRAHDLGKGAIAMKVLGAGTLASDLPTAFSFVLRLPYIHAICVGMRTMQEIQSNVDMVAKLDSLELQLTKQKLFG